MMEAWWVINTPRPRPAEARASPKRGPTLVARVVPATKQVKLGEYTLGGP